MTENTPAAVESTPAVAAAEKKAAATPAAPAADKKTTSTPAVAAAEKKAGSTRRTADAPRPDAPEGDSAKDAAPTTHTVKDGETLESIAKEHSVEVASLLRLNAIKRPDLIWPGMELKTS